jgi:hypothetical protein
MIDHCPICGFKLIVKHSRYHPNNSYITCGQADHDFQVFHEMIILYKNRVEVTYYFPEFTDHQDRLDGGVSIVTPVFRKEIEVIFNSIEELVKCFYSIEESLVFL